MKQTNSPAYNLQLYHRLIALWVICEAVLGGIIHGLKLPVSGLIVGSSAVLCICLIGYYVPQKGAILKATVIVAVFKMMLSPQAPPPAYIAVFFQGLLGQLLFSSKRFFQLSCILLGVLALVESALQRIIVMVLLYGNKFWKAVDAFISKISGQATVNNYSLLFATGYVVLHAIVGLGVGLLAVYIIKKTRQIKSIPEVYLIEGSETLSEKNNRKKLRFKPLLIASWVFIIALLIQSYTQPQQSFLPKNAIVGIIIRFILIVLTWYLFLNPLIDFYLKKWLKKQQSKSQNQIAQVALLLPSTQYLISKSWQLSAPKKGWRRVVQCCKIILMNTLLRHG